MTEDVNVTELLRQAADGDDSAYDKVVEWAYGELEGLARARLRRQYQGGPPTLEPAALVNETFLRLLPEQTEFQNRRHLLAFANTVMLRVLIDYQRERGAKKRGGDALLVTLSDLGGANQGGLEMIDFQEALNRLEQLDSRKAEVINLRLFWGYEMAEIADLMGISLTTIERDWRFARNWMAEALLSS